MNGFSSGFAFFSWVFIERLFVICVFCCFGEDGEDGEDDEDDDGDGDDKDGEDLRHLARRLRAPPATGGALYERNRQTMPSNSPATAGHHPAFGTVQVVFQGSFWFFSGFFVLVFFDFSIFWRNLGK